MVAGVASILAILAAAVGPAGHPPVETVAVLLLAVGFAAPASLDLGPLEIHLLAQSHQPLLVELHVGAILALALLAAEELVGKALAV